MPPFVVKKKYKCKYQVLLRRRLQKPLQMKFQPISAKTQNISSFELKSIGADINSRGQCRDKDDIHGNPSTFFIFSWTFIALENYVRNDSFLLISLDMLRTFQRLTFLGLGLSWCIILYRFVARVKRSQFNAKNLSAVWHYQDQLRREKDWKGQHQIISFSKLFLSPDSLSLWYEIHEKRSQEGEFNLVGKEKSSLEDDDDSLVSIAHISVSTFDISQDVKLLSFLMILVQEWKGALVGDTV